MRRDEYREDCTVCGSKLEYKTIGRQAACYFCGKQETTNIICSQGHYVCDSCHGRGVSNAIASLAADLALQDPLEIAERLFKLPHLPMLGCEHALITVAALLVALRNSGQMTITGDMLNEAMQRTKRQAIGGYCGLTGICGVTIGIGATFSVLLGAACPKDRETRLAMQVMGRVVNQIAELTGPCCCKAFVRQALKVSIDACREAFGVELPVGEPAVCQYSQLHPHGCRGRQCPYHKGST